MNDQAMNTVTFAPVISAIQDMPATPTTPAQPSGHLNHRLPVEFFLGGHATFTVSLGNKFQSTHQECPDHYTYQITKKPSNAGGWIYFVSLLYGPQNTHDFSYIGVLDSKLGKMHCSAKSAANEDSWPVKILNRVLARVWGGEHDKIFEAGWGLNHCDQCARCGRTLTTEESVSRGIGPECWKKMGG